jgi:hypothetical protein
MAYRIYSISSSYRLYFCYVSVTARLVALSLHTLHNYEFNYKWLGYILVGKLSQPLREFNILKLPEQPLSPLLYSLCDSRVCFFLLLTHFFSEGVPYRELCSWFGYVCDKLQLYICTL